ncbi:radical SAM family heme chaperone HemW [Dinoroseobacter sp. S124A]|uniref:radical SAM family heme chaperone HemW n=1 Tax=Dinoroseobacter sp. S124A TaxID=3415128 RepID=UPI003C7EBF2A
MEDWQHGGFGLYLHWPFCASKCPYCDFNSHVRDRVDQDLWRTALLSEIDRVGQETKGRTLDTVFFGGGTPSLMDPDLVADLMDRIRATWRTSNSFETSLEANPSSVEAGRFRAYRDAGINRVSMGVQALNDRDLRALGRLHSVAEARKAFDIARDCFDRVSFDLIYARQDLTLQDWEAELKTALNMAVDHLSLYQLTIEPGTAFGARAAIGRLPGLPDEDLGADMYERTQEICGVAGMPAYEVSNHARPDAMSRHNLIYWRYGDYAGVGPGAHGRLSLTSGKWATSTHLSPEKWLDAVQKTGNGETPRSRIPFADQADEMLMMGLRLHDGVSTDRYEALSGHALPVEPLNELIETGLLKLDGTQLRATSSGMMVLNAVLRQLLVAHT